MKASYLLVNPSYTGNPVSGTVENSGYTDKMYKCLHCLKQPIENISVYTKGMLHSLGTVNPWH